VCAKSLFINTLTAGAREAYLRTLDHGEGLKSEVGCIGKISYGSSLKCDGELEYLKIF